MVLRWLSKVSMSISSSRVVCPSSSARSEAHSSGRMASPELCQKPLLLARRSTPETIIPPWFGERLDLDHAIYICLANEKLQQDRAAGRPQPPAPVQIPIPV